MYIYIYTLYCYLDLGELNTELLQEKKDKEKDKDKEKNKDRSDCGLY